MALSMLLLKPMWVLLLGLLTPPLSDLKRVENVKLICNWKMTAGDM